MAKKKITQKKPQSISLFKKHPNLRWLLPLFILAVAVVFFIHHNDEETSSEVSRSKITPINTKDATLVLAGVKDVIRYTIPLLWNESETSVKNIESTKNIQIVVTLSSPDYKVGQGGPYAGCWITINHYPQHSHLAIGHMETDKTVDPHGYNFHDFRVDGHLASSFQGPGLGTYLAIEKDQKSFIEVIYSTVDSSAQKRCQLSYDHFVNSIRFK